MTTFQRVMALYWCLLPLELAYVWLDGSRLRAPWGTWSRMVAARRQLRLMPGAGAAYATGFAAILGLVARFHRLDQAQQLLGGACAALLVLSAWQDARRTIDAWHESGHGGWWRRLLRRVPRPRRLRRGTTPAAAAS